MTTIIIPSSKIFRKEYTIGQDNKIENISYETNTLDFSSESADFNVYVDDYIFDEPLNISDFGSFINTDETYNGKNVYDMYISSSAYVGFPIAIITQDDETKYCAFTNEGTSVLTQVYYPLPDVMTAYKPVTFLSKPWNIFRLAEDNTLLGKMTIVLKTTNENMFAPQGTINLEFSGTIFDTTTLTSIADDSITVTIYDGTTDKNETAHVEINLATGKVYVENTGDVSDEYTEITLVNGSKEEVKIEAASVNLFSKSNVSYITKPILSDDSTQINIDIYLYLVFSNIVARVEHDEYYEYIIKAAQEPNSNYDMFVDYSVDTASANIITRSSQSTTLNEKSGIYAINTNELFNEITTVDEKNIFDYMCDRISAEYKNGKQTATIACFVTDYYDEDGGRVISTEIGNSNNTRIKCTKAVGHEYYFQELDTRKLCDGDRLSFSNGRNFVVKNYDRSTGEFHNNILSLYAFSTDEVYYANMPMLFDIGDTVIPYVYTNKGDKPLSYNKDLTPKQFKVVGTKISKEQGITQELTLQEV